MFGGFFFFFRFHMHLFLTVVLQKRKLKSEGLEEISPRAHSKWQSWNFNSDPDSPIVCAVLFLIEKFVREHLVLKGGKCARVMEV